MVNNYIQIFRLCINNVFSNSNLLLLPMQYMDLYGNACGGMRQAAVLEV